MELSNLLNTMVQGAETGSLAQIQSRGASQAGANPAAQAAANGGGSITVTLSGQAALTLASQPPGLNVTGQSGAGMSGQPGLVGGQSGVSLTGQPGLAGGQSGVSLTGQPGLAGGQTGPNPTGQSGLAGAQPGLNLTGQAGQGLGLTGQGAGQAGLSLTGQPGALNLAGQPGTNGAQPAFNLPGQSGTNGGQPAFNIPGQSGMSGGQPAFNIPGQPGTSGGPPAFNLAGQSGASGGQTLTLTGQPNTGVAGPGALQPATLTAGLPALRTGSPGLGATADTYYGSQAPASPSLLSQSGVGAYIQLLNAFASHEVSDKSANLITNNLGTASATLKSAYYQAVATLPNPLQQKDWGFCVANGTLVFTQGKDALSAQDLADLQKAFGGANVEFSAREVAAAMTSIAERRQLGADSGSLAWGAVDADDSVVNLRTYVTTSAPGTNYHPNTPDPILPPQIPNLLGGMDLRELVSARPNFFHADGSVVTDTAEAEEAPSSAADTGTLQGQCSCGHLRFTVENTFEYAFFCHCSRCRIRTGSAFAAVAGIGIDKVRVTAGSDALLIEGECSDGYGARCGRCHAFLFAAVRERQYMHVSLGVLEGTPNRLPDHHIYVGSKAPWFEITDSLPQYDELP